MKGKVNFYFSMLLIALMGAGAALLIIHVSNANNFTTTIGGSEANYRPLERSLLK